MSTDFLEYSKKFRWNSDRNSFVFVDSTVSSPFRPMNISVISFTTYSLCIGFPYSLVVPVECVRSGFYIVWLLRAATCLLLGAGSTRGGDDWIMGYLGAGQNGGRYDRKSGD